MADTTGRALLSHISQYHAGIVADVIAARVHGRKLRDDELIARDVGSTPQVIFTDPQVIEVGRTEKEARSDGFTVRTRSAKYSQAVSQLAIFRDNFDAQAKLVIDDATDTLLGATFVGREFSELVHAATLAVVAKVPLETLRHVVAPHPSINQVWNPLVAKALAGVMRCLVLLRILLPPLAAASSVAASAAPSATAAAAVASQISCPVALL